MIIDFLQLTDFRVFRGVHKFDLAPKKRAGHQRPIILFGGLNGAGKTTILTALKLALYGRGSLGAVSLNEYHEYLRASIHKTFGQSVQSTYACIEISFQYAHQGKMDRYLVKRDWSISPSGKVSEALLIECEQGVIGELSYEQSQAFLNELIPIGVSELFFFDGEKIKALAEETTGDALRASIHKLLGLDVVGRLDSDLSTLIRTRIVGGTHKDKLKKVLDLENEFGALKATIGERQDDFQSILSAIAEIEKNIQYISNKIEARGGAWGASRKSDERKLEDLVASKALIEAQLRELVSSILPVHISANLASRALGVAQEERAEEINVSFRKTIKARRKSFERKLGQIRGKENILAAYDQAFLDITSKEKKKSIHELSDGRIAGIAHQLEVLLPAEIRAAKSFIKRIEEIDESIESIGVNISRAPDEAILMPFYQEISDLSVALGRERAKRDTIVEDLKGLASRLSDVARKIDAAYSMAAAGQDADRLRGIAERSRALLKEFSVRTTQRKLEELQARFTESFRRLARKKAAVPRVAIDPDSFDVVLMAADGDIINKNDLSAGEKQIYAISILEALARTSGRNLPVIIDTPLGRLDSHHRQRLIENYFPKASHQVLILSTDTEIDHSFYQDLSPYVSHAYHLVFDADSKSTAAVEEYFWKLEEAV